MYLVCFSLWLAHLSLCRPCDACVAIDCAVPCLVACPNPVANGTLGGLLHRPADFRRGTPRSTLLHDCAGAGMVGLDWGRGCLFLVYFELI
jgi:hypothetical protein